MISINYNLDSTRGTTLSSLFLIIFVTNVTFCELWSGLDLRRARGCCCAHAQTRNSRYVHINSTGWIFADPSRDLTTVQRCTSGVVRHYNRLQLVVSTSCGQFVLLIITTNSNTKHSNYWQTLLCLHPIRCFFYSFISSAHYYY